MPEPHEQDTTPPIGPLAPPRPAGARRNLLRDADHPAFPMGAAAEAIGVTPGFLRALGRAGLFQPHRSTGGHRRYSRTDLEHAARARELVDEGVPVAAAVRIVHLESQLAAANAALDLLRRRQSSDGTARGATGRSNQVDLGHNGG